MVEHKSDIRWVNHRIGLMDDIADSLSNKSLTPEGKVRLELALDRLMRAVGRVLVR